MYLAARAFFRRSFLGLCYWERSTDNETRSLEQRRSWGAGDPAAGSINSTKELLLHRERKWLIKCQNEASLLHLHRQKQHDEEGYFNLPYIASDPLRARCIFWRLSIFNLTNWVSGSSHTPIALDVKRRCSSACLCGFEWVLPQFFARL